MRVPHFKLHKVIIPVHIFSKSKISPIQVSIPYLWHRLLCVRWYFEFGTVCVEVIELAKCVLSLIIVLFSTSFIEVWFNESNMQHHSKTMILDN